VAGAGAEGGVFTRRTAAWRARLRKLHLAGAHLAQQMAWQSDFRRRLPAAVPVRLQTGWFQGWR
jgi:hypothetical protein